MILMIFFDKTPGISWFNVENIEYDNLNLQ